MDQLIFKFPFTRKYYEQDYYVSSNNFTSYRLIENWPHWPDKWVNIYGPTGCGKTHLSNVLKKKIKHSMILDTKNINGEVIPKLEGLECIILDNFDKNIDENTFYSILNQSKQLDIFVVINSKLPLKDSFITLGIELPTDELLRVIITKSFSDKQIEISPKTSEYIIKNIERSYEKIFQFIKEIDDLSLSSGKSININLIKKVLGNE